MGAGSSSEAPYFKKTVSSQSLTNMAVDKHFDPYGGSDEVDHEAEDDPHIADIVARINRGDQLTEADRDYMVHVYGTRVVAKRTSLRYGGYVAEREAELRRLCTSVLRLMNKAVKSCGPNDQAALVVYLKTKGDYCRYLLELDRALTREERGRVVTEGTLAYKRAAALGASGPLPPSHPTRLSLALNTAIFYHQVLGRVQEAVQVAQQALQEAAPGVQAVERGGPRGRSMADDDGQQSVLLYQLLKDNVTMWSESPMARGVSRIDTTHHR